MYLDILMYRSAVWQDEDGDTVLHDALYKKHNDVVDILLQCPRINFSLINKRSFTVLHMATFKGNIEWVSSVDIIVFFQGSQGFR